MLCVSMCRLVKILLLLVALIPACHCQPKEEDEWIDPFDMLNFDPGSGQMRKKVKEADVKEPPKGTVATSAEDEQVSCEQPDASAPDDCQISSAGRKDSQLDSTVASGDNQPSSSEHPPPDKPPQFKQNPNLPKHKISSNRSAYKTILRKHVKMLLDKWKTQAYSEDSAVRMTMALSASDRNLLAEFAESGLGDLYDVDEVLGKMVVRVDPADSFSYPGSRLESYIGISLPTVIQILAVLALVSVVLWIETKLLISWRQKIVKLIFLAFFISIPWTWYHMYKQEEAKRQSEMMRDIPEVCVRRHLSWYEMAVEVARSTFTLSEDQCVKYYEQMLVDPVWKVAPTEAIAVTFVRFFVSPAKHVGQALSEFVKGVFQHLPVTLWPIVLVCGMIILGLILLLSFGYSIRLPFLLSIESSHAHSSKHQLQIMTNQSTQQQNQIEDLKSQLKRVEGERLMLMQSGFTPLHGTISEPSVRYINIHPPRSSVSDQSVQGQGTVGMPMLTQGVQSVGFPLNKQGVHLEPNHEQSTKELITQQCEVERTQDCDEYNHHTCVQSVKDFKQPVCCSAAREDEYIYIDTRLKHNEKLDGSEESLSNDKFGDIEKDVINTHTDLSKQLASLEIHNDAVVPKMDCLDAEAPDVSKAGQGVLESTALEVENIGIGPYTSDSTDLHPPTSPTRQM